VLILQQKRNNLHGFSLYHRKIKGYYKDAGFGVELLELQCQLMAVH